MATIFELVQAGNTAEVLALLANDPEQIRQKNAEGKTPVEVAEAAGHANLATQLKKLPSNVLGLGPALDQLEKENSEQTEKAIKVKAESQAKLETLAATCNEKVKRLLDEIEKVNVEHAKARAAEEARAKTEADKANAALATTSQLLSIARRMDADYTQQVTRNLHTLSDEGVYVLLRRAGVEVDLEQLRKQMVNGEVLVHNYKDPLMLTSIGITLLGPRLRCQQLIEKLLSGRPFSSLRFLQAAIPEGTAYDGSFETLTPARLAEHVGTSYGLAADFIRQQQIAGDVLDHPQFDALMRQCAHGSSVPFGAAAGAALSLKKLVEENPRTDFVPKTLAEVRELLSKDDAYFQKKIENSSRMQSLGGAALPPHIIDPVSDVPMVDAVTTDDGAVYDRFVIEAWFRLLRETRPATVPEQRVRFTSPVTGAVISTRLVPNTSVFNAINAFLHEQSAAN
eukprot:m.10016 g.10016  ORF g.10016 m.10016 type:complete len:454 (-) comp5109_c0_seq1:275-1636(-)